MVRQPPSIRGNCARQMGYLVSLIVRTLFSSNSIKIPQNKVIDVHIHYFLTCDSAQCKHFQEQQFVLFYSLFSLSLTLSLSHRIVENRVAGEWPRPRDAFLGRANDMKTNDVTLQYSGDAIATVPRWTWSPFRLIMSTHKSGPAFSRGSLRFDIGRPHIPRVGKSRRGNTPAKERSSGSFRRSRGTVS